MGDHDGGANGRDTLDGGSGADILVGGGSADVLVGGLGGDTFRFDHINDLGVGHCDVIRDFSRTEGDRIDLRGIDANGLLSGNQAFTLATTEAQKQMAGRYWLSEIGTDGRQSVFVNVDGGAADGQVIVFFKDPATAGLLGRPTSSSDLPEPDAGSALRRRGSGFRIGHGEPMD